MGHHDQREGGNPSIEPGIIPGGTSSASASFSDGDGGVEVILPTVAAQANSSFWSRRILGWGAWLFLAVALLALTRVRRWDDSRSKLARGDL